MEELMGSLANATDSFYRSKWKSRVCPFLDLDDS